MSKYIKDMFTSVLQDELSIPINSADIKFVKNKVRYENPHSSIAAIEMKPDEIILKYNSKRSENLRIVTKYILKKNEDIAVAFVYDDGGREILGSGETNKFQKSDLEFLEFMGPGGLKNLYTTLQEIVNFRRYALKIRAHGTPGKRRFAPNNVTIVPIENVLPYLPESASGKYKKLSPIEKQMGLSRAEVEPLGTDTFDSRVLGHDIGIEGIFEISKISEEK